MSQGFARAEVFAFPTGVLGYATRTSNDSIITSETDVADCSVTVTPGAGRTIRITGYANVRKLSGDGHITGRIYEDSTQIGFWLSQDSISSASDDNDKQGTGFAIVEGDGTEHTYKLTLEDTDGGTCRVLAGASDTSGSFGPAYIVVEDVTDSDPLVVEQHNDHGRLDGKDDDDHTQYLNDTRHNAAHGAGRWERSATQTISNTTFTTVVWDDLIREDDPDGDFTMNTGTGVLTINNAGWYMVSTAILFTNVPGSTRVVVDVEANGTEIARQTSEVTGGAPGIPVSVLYYFSASDTVSTDVWQNSGGNLDITSLPRTYFSVMKVRE